MRGPFRYYIPFITATAVIIVTTRLLSLDMSTLIQPISYVAFHRTSSPNDDDYGEVVCDIRHENYHRIQHRPTLTKIENKPILLAAVTDKNNVIKNMQKTIQIWSYNFFDNQKASSNHEIITKQNENNDNSLFNLMIHTTFPYNDNGVNYIPPNELQSFDQIILVVSNPLSAIFQENKDGEVSYNLWKNGDKKKNVKEFQEKLKMWTQHIEYWMDLQLHVNPFIFSMEAFLGSNSGTVTTAKFIQYIQNYIGIEDETVSQSIDIGCIWKQVFWHGSYSNDDDYSYVTFDQFQQMLNAIVELKSQYYFIPELLNIFNQYIQYIEQIMWNLHSDEF